MHRFRDGAVGRCERGQTMTEYALVLAVITLAIVTSIALLSSTAQSLLQQVVDVL